MTWNYQEIQSDEGKPYMLRFLPYLEADALIGYTPAWVKRGYGYGRWEEFFLTEAEAKARMDFLIAAEAIEDAEIRQEVVGQGMMTTLVAFWPNPED